MGLPIRRCSLCIVEIVLAASVCLLSSWGVLAQNDGAADDTNIPYLIDKLRKYNDDSVRSRAIEALSKIPSSSVVPALSRELKNTDQDQGIRSGAAITLGLIGTDDEQAISVLIETLNDADSRVQYDAELALVRIGPNTFRHLISALKSRSQPEEIRSRAASVLGNWQNDDAVSSLLEALNSDRSEKVRRAAALALSHDLAQPRVLDELIKALKTERASADVRSSIVFALKQDRANTKLVVRALAEYLNSEEDEEVRFRILNAFEDLPFPTTPAETVPLLVQALKKEESPRVRIKLADRLGVLTSWMDDTEVFRCIEPLKETEVLLSKFGDSESQQTARIIRVRLSGVNSQPFLALREWRQSPLGWTIGAYLFLLLICVGVLWLRPITLLWINETISNSVEFRLPDWLGGITLPLRHVLIVGFFHYHPRVLDAWVSEHVPLARKSFLEKPTVEERNVHIPVPVVFQGSYLPEFTTDNLGRTFSARLAYVLIQGEGGAGKTSLACQIGKAAMLEHKPNRLCRDHIMLPVLIEQDLTTEGIRDDGLMLKLIKDQTRALIKHEKPLSTSLVTHLLMRRRILVVIDGFSEQTDESRAHILAGLTDVPINACVITSRAEEPLRDLPHTIIKPIRIRGNRLSTFMEAYFLQRRKRELFDDEEFFELCRRLSSIVGDREITPLLAKLYAEQMIAIKDGAADELPENIPDLMLKYLNTICRRSLLHGTDIRAVHQAAKVVAWECLRLSYRPAAADRAVVLKALGGDEHGLKPLEYLEYNLRIIETIGEGKNRVRFTLDPLSEYLAAQYLVEKNGENDHLWQEFLARITDDTAEATKGFLLAVRDCCLSMMDQTPVPNFVAEEIAKRVRMNQDDLEHHKIHTRIKRLVNNLTSPEVEDRVEAAESLGRMGPKVDGAALHLVNMLGDENSTVRNSVANALAQIGPAALCSLTEGLSNENVIIRRSSTHLIRKLGPDAKSAIDALTKSLDDTDHLVRDGAVQALGEIGPAAESVIPRLFEKLADPDSFVRNDAAKAIKALAQKIPPIIIERSADPDPFVRWRVIDILVKFPSSLDVVLPILIDRLDDEDEQVRSMATHGLISFAESAVPSLCLALKNSSLEVRRRAAYALAQIGPAAKAAVSDLIFVLREHDNALRANAIRALGKIGSEAKTAVPFLKELLEDPKVDIQQAAIKALRRIN